MKSDQDVNTLHESEKYGYWILSDRVKFFKGKKTGEWAGNRRLGGLMMGLGRLGFFVGLGQSINQSSINPLQSN